MRGQNEQLEHLAEMRALMERSSRFISLSGLSGVFAGLAGLIGAGVLYWFYGMQYYYPNHANSVYTEDGQIRDSFINFLFLDAAGILAVAIGLGAFFTIRKAKRQGQKKVILHMSQKIVFLNRHFKILTQKLTRSIPTTHPTVEMIYEQQPGKTKKDKKVIFHFSTDTKN